MCARYTIKNGVMVAIPRFSVKAERAADFPPRFNVAPSQNAPVVLWGEGGRTLELFRWGLIPSWAKDAKIGQKLFNARGETVHEKPSFRNAFKKRRSLVPADGFFEWPEKGEPALSGVEGFPRRVRRKDEGLFSFAGLWEQWTSPKGQEVKSYTIITTEPNEFMAPVHDRMPVILTSDQEDEWLNPETPQDRLISLLKTREWDDMEVYTVSKLVNSPRNDYPEVIEPLAIGGDLQNTP